MTLGKLFVPVLSYLCKPRKTVVGIKWVNSCNGLRTMSSTAPLLADTIFGPFNRYNNINLEKVKMICSQLQLTNSRREPNSVKQILTFHCISLLSKG
jgi:hypothetical protein